MGGEASPQKEDDRFDVAVVKFVRGLKRRSGRRDRRIPASRILWTIYCLLATAAGFPLAYLNFTQSGATRTGWVGWVSDWSFWIMFGLCAPGVIRAFVAYNIRKEEVRFHWPWE